VREALLERQLMVKLAPHLVKPLPLSCPRSTARAPTASSGSG
jgi:glycerol-3-phosphate dehydrogenase